MTSALGDAAAGLIIRLEKLGDVDAIHVLTDEAFDGQPFSSGTEAAIVRALRASGDLTLSLVAEESGRIIGHVAFSPVSVGSSEGRWFGLGPISVTPKRQRQGIGRRLVRRGLEFLETGGSAGCALIGDPNIYGRFGFTSGGLTYKGVYHSLVQYAVLNGSAAPKGELVFASAFDET
jgi:putative acetyltransferase